jgi:RimJ/RimL family protein N-acetyltransferase
MRLNANLALAGTACCLVPYRREHVPKYHAWMQDASLREATASEPLSLDEEYEMQASWAEDEKKCTFIVLCVSNRESLSTPASSVASMVGDVNLYFNDHDDARAGEIEIMIADVAARRKGIAQEALRLMMGYAVHELGVRTFVAKIGFDNEKSIALFRKLGFAERSTSEVFRETTFACVPGEETGVAGAIEEVWRGVRRWNYDDAT